MIYLKERKLERNYLASDGNEYFLIDFIPDKIFNGIRPIYKLKDIDQNKANIEEIDYINPDSDAQQFIDDEIADNIEDEQKKKALDFITYNFDKVKELLSKMDIINMEPKPGFNNMFIDDFSSFNNINIPICENIQFFEEKGILQIKNTNENGFVKTKSLPINAQTVKINGQGMVLEYNFGMVLRASNDGGATWEDFTFETKNMTFVHTFQSQPTGDFQIEFQIVPKAISPGEPVTGKAYVTSFAILY